MKSIKGETYEVHLDEGGSTIYFKGALRLSGEQDYAPILDLLKETINHPSADSVLDLRELDFLNSSGITMFSRFVIEARGRVSMSVTILASESIPWHARSLKNLQRLMPSLNIRLT
ncbi:MAG: hypothetical protein ABI693_30405 [Bryobacteraceae bacterium]